MKEAHEQFFDGYKNKIKSSLYGLLCEKEKNGEWEKFLDTIVIELTGHAAYCNGINYWALLGKLHMLRYLTYPYFRKTVFECMNLVAGLDEP